MNYYIVIKSAGVVLLDEFLEQLKRRWPLVHSEKVMSQRTHAEILEFELPMTEGALQGSLAQDGKGVIVHSGGIDDCAEFARWCRSLISPDEEVLFCDDSMGIDFVLKPDMSSSDIARILRAS